MKLKNNRLRTPNNYASKRKLSWTYEDAFQNLHRYFDAQELADLLLVSETHAYRIIKDPKNLKPHHRRILNLWMVVSGAERIACTL